MLRNFLVAAALACAALCLVSPAALAQSGICKPDDLRCRLDRLEARVEAMDAAHKAEIAATPPPSPTEIIRAYMACRRGCIEEAQTACTESGFVSGEPKLIEHPKIGPLLLRSALCHRR